MNEAKYRLCPYCKSAMYGYDVKCMFCDTPAKEITKEEFEKIIELIKKSNKY